MQPPLIRDLIRSVAGESPEREDPLAGDGPFLSIITRTQGKRVSALRDVFMCLAGQSCDDFEQVLVGHKVAEPDRTAILEMVQDLPQRLRDRIRVFWLDEGQRSAPLNLGLAEARGRYFSVLDDDDIVFDNWVEAFRDAAIADPGRIVRTIAVDQEFDEIDCSGLPTPRAVGMIETRYGAPFDFLYLLKENDSPTLCLAYPRFLFTLFGLTYDDSLTTLEDYDFLLRAASLCGVRSVPLVTSIYRIWRRGENSRSLHNEQEWLANLKRVRDKLIDRPILLPPAATETILEWAAEKIQKRDRTQNPAALALVREIEAIYDSSSWRLTGPYRGLAKLIGKPTPSHPNLRSLSYTELQYHLASLKRSSSWRISAPIRALRRMF